MATIRGGDRLEKYLLELAQKVTKPSTLRVGFLQGATYPDGKPVAMIAAIQDYGAPSVGIPPRPFFRNMVADKSPRWGNLVATTLRAQNWEADRTMQTVGVVISDQLRQSILDTNAPPLAPSTVARKGFDKPLIDRGHMLSSVDFEVR